MEINRVDIEISFKDFHCRMHHNPPGRTIDEKIVSEKLYKGIFVNEEKLPIKNCLCRVEQ